MRVCLLIGLMALAGCVSGPTSGGTSPDHKRDYGFRAEPGRVQTGGESQAFVFNLRPDPAVDGDFVSASWNMRFPDYCRDQPSFVQSRIEGPDGRVWYGFRVFVPAGPIRGQDWSGGSTEAIGPGAMATPGLLEALLAGGVFTLSIETATGTILYPNQFTVPSLDVLSDLGRKAMAMPEEPLIMVVRSDTPPASPGTQTCPNPS